MMEEADGLEKQLLGSSSLWLQRLWAEATVGEALPGSSTSAATSFLSLAKSKPWDVEKFLNSE